MNHKPRDTPVLVGVRSYKVASVDVVVVSSFAVGDSVREVCLLRHSVGLLGLSQRHKIDLLTSPSEPKDAAQVRALTVRLSRGAL